jgi:D-alanyl-D-alanine carboxypeptidase
VSFDAAVLDRVDHTTVPSLAVGVCDGGSRTVVTGGRLPVTATSPYRIASLTKLFTAAATTLVLLEREIPLSVRALELVPHLAADWKADPAITVDQLLGQVAGLRPSVDAAAVAALGDGPGPLEDVARLVIRAGSVRPPGQRWSYYNGNYFLVGAVLAAVTSSSYEQALTDILLRPWKLTRTGFETPTEPVSGWDGVTPAPDEQYPRGRRPSGGLWSCVNDLLTFAERLLDEPALLAAIRQPRTHSSDVISYGLGWALGPSGQMYVNGRLPGYRSAIVVVPDDRYASVALANHSTALPELAGLLSDVQRPLTGDDLSTAIDLFAA